MISEKERKKIYRKVHTDSEAQHRAQHKWYRKRQAFRHLHHLKSSPAHIRSSKRWAKKHRDKERHYQKKSYSKNFVLYKASSKQLIEAYHKLQKKEKQIRKRIS